MINRVWRAILLFQQELIYLNDFRLKVSSLTYKQDKSVKLG